MHGLRARHVLLMLAAFAVASCASLSGPMQRLDDPAFYQKHGVWEFPVGRDACYAAARSALNEIGAGLTREDADAGSLISGRRLAASYETSTEVAMGAGSTERTEIFAERTEIYVKYYLKVDGDAGACTVRLVRMMLFENTRELEAEAAGFVTHRVLDLGGAVKTAIDDLAF